MPKANALFSTSRVLVAVGVIVTLLLAACGSSPSVVSVTIAGGNFSLQVGATKTLTANVSVTGGAAQTVTWSSNHMNIATVASNGTVTAHAVGTAVITATSTADHSKSDTVTVTVTAATTAPTINSFGATPSTVTEGDTVTVRWDVTGATSLSLSDGTNNITIPQTATGGVTLTPPAGSVTYTLTATNSIGSVTDTATVTVTAATVVPTISDFSASSTSVAPGSSTDLSWTTSGATSWSLSDGSNPITISQSASGTVTVTPSAASTTYTLTATNSVGSSTATVTVTIQPPAISGLTATVGMQSTLDLSWTATGATSYDVYSVLNTDSTDQQIIDSGLTTTSDTIAIPPSTRRIIRVVATGQGGTDQADVTPTNVVYSTADYDPYHENGRTSDTPIPGTLHDVLANAAAGSIIGFASDITSLDVAGVDNELVSGVGNLDSHLIFRNDVTVSGPAGGVVLNAVPAPNASSDPFVWQSRVMLVLSGVTVHLDHLTIQGGTFIYNGAGIENQGDLTLTNTTVTGNRAWQQGGGIFNTSGSTLTLTDSHIDGNEAWTKDSEMGTTYNIRDGSYTTTPSDGGYGGGLFNNGGTVTITNTSFDGNYSKYSGGGVYNPSGTITMDNSPVTNNTADYTGLMTGASPFAYGGGIYNAGTLDFSNADITGNTVTDLGGGFAIDNAGTSTLTNVLFDNDTATWGGGIEHYYCTDPSNLTLDNVTYGTNHASGGNRNIDEVDTCASSPVRSAPAMQMAPGIKAPSNQR